MICVISAAFSRRAQFWFFVLATFCVVPAFLINLSGGRLNPQQLDFLKVSAVSIANVGIATSNGNITANPWGSLGEQQYDSRQISALIMAVDFAMVWLFLLFILFLYGRIRAVTAEVDAKCVLRHLRPPRQPLYPCVMHLPPSQCHHGVRLRCFCPRPSSRRD